MTVKSMDVVSLRDMVVGEYRKFATSFTTIHAEDIRVQVEAIYAEARSTLGLDQPLRVRGLAEGHRRYLPWHRERVFKHGGQHG